jgi:hypothetical protein
MPFTLIAGSFAPGLGFPDGDSLRFIPNDPEPIFRLRRRGSPPKINPKNGSIQLRYEGIDTLEKAAIKPFSSDATASNLELAGTAGGTTNAPGYIYSNQLGPHGRPIAFVFAGEAPGKTGDEKYLEPDDIMDSINVLQLARGHAYPLFYDTLFDDLRQRLTEVTLEAKEARKGVWEADRTSSGVEWDGGPATMAPIFPKLWRRIDEFTRDETFFDPEQPLAGLKRWMEIAKPERVSVPHQSIFTGFDNLLETTDTTVRMIYEPHEVVVISA